MLPVLPCALPPVAFLRKYVGDTGYVDCYVSEVAGSVSQAAFVEAFYTTGLFKVERTVLKWFAGRPSTDFDAKQLSAGSLSSFAAWRVEAQDAEQLLLADFTGRTRSWLMAVEAVEAGEAVEDVVAVAGKATTHASRTRLYFGSAVVPRKDRATGRQRMGFAFHALLGFHRLYSRLLLGAASARVMRAR